MKHGKLDPQKRIDLQIMEMRPDLSRTTIKKLLKDGVIKVSGESVLSNYKPSEDDVIQIKESDIKRYLIENDDWQVRAKDHNIEVIYEDEDTIVVNKESGLNSHPVFRNDKDSLLNGIYYYVHNKSKFDKDVRLRLVHRLDKETSGVVICAKNLEALEFYSNQFEGRNVKKTYYAIVKGNFEALLEKKNLPYMSYNSYIGPDTKNKKAFRNTDSKKGKLAKTNISFVSHFNKFGKRRFSLVKVVPETGRTHQIRVHLSTLGFPIFGDTLYGGQKYKRLMLHAYSLEIKLFKTKEFTRFQAELPEKFIDPHAKISA